MSNICSLIIDFRQIMVIIALILKFEVFLFIWSFSYPLGQQPQGQLSKSTESPITSWPLPLGVSAPFPADLFQNVSFSPRLCCLFYRSLSLCCERLRLLVMEVNLTNLCISPFSFSFVFLLFFLNTLFSFLIPRFISPPVYCFVFIYRIYKSSVYWCSLLALVIFLGSCAMLTKIQLYLAIQYISLWVIFLFFHKNLRSEAF